MDKSLFFFFFFWISNLFYFTSYFNIFWYSCNISSINNYTIRELNQKIAIYKLYFNCISFHFHDKGNEINISIVPLPFSWIINLRLNHKWDYLIKFVWIYPIIIIIRILKLFLKTDSQRKIFKFINLAISQNVKYYQLVNSLNKFCFLINHLFKFLSLHSSL